MAKKPRDAAMVTCALCAGIQPGGDSEEDGVEARMQEPDEVVRQPC